ncbi:ABC transporter permease [Leuconostoc rapi]|uniref:ABC transporter permease n=1 Tax=Leuconostoc rapi TaxID=1406906 RepID=UPI0019587B83|nr:ABC transporter permease [Leuconostoc rapi]MBM7435840.1 ABC-2 type transport system permease protein [Leuconostoc rapi]
MTLNNLFMQRFARAQRTNMKYLRLLFNDHFVVFLLIAFGVGVLGYRQLITSPILNSILQSNCWWLVEVLWMLLGLQVGTIVTYLKPADRLYLMGSDQIIIKKYFNHSMILSTIYGALWQLAFVVVLTPILVQSHRFTLTRMMLLLLFMVSYKWLLLLATRATFFVNPRLVWLESHVIARRLLLNFLVPAMMTTLIRQLPSDFIWMFGSVWMILIVLLGRVTYISESRSNSLAIDWPVAVSQAIDHEQRVLHFYATFAEVPNQPRTSKRRHYLDVIIKWLAKRQPVIYRLYLTRFMRDTELLPLIMRLITVAIIILYALNDVPTWLIAGIASLMMYLVIFQLVPLYTTTQQNIWTRLLPIDNKSNQKAFSHLIKQMMMILIVLFTCVSAIHGWMALIAVGITMCVVSLFLNRVYIPQKIK